MTERLPSQVELQRTDELLDRIADRRTPLNDDRVLDMLASLADAVDESPVPALPTPRVEAVRSLHRTRTHSRRLAAGLAIGLGLSSSGIAAAVTGDPLLPVKAVAIHLYEESQEPPPGSPWILGAPDRPSGRSGLERVSLQGATASHDDQPPGLRMQSAAAQNIDMTIADSGERHPGAGTSSPVSAPSAQGAAGDTSAGSSGTTTSPDGSGSTDGAQPQPGAGTPPPVVTTGTDTPPPPPPAPPPPPPAPVVPTPCTPGQAPDPTAVPVDPCPTPTPPPDPAPPAPGGTGSASGGDTSVGGTDGGDTGNQDGDAQGIVAGGAIATDTTTTSTPASG